MINNNSIVKCKKCSADMNWAMDNYALCVCNNCGEINSEVNFDDRKNFTGLASIYSAIKINENGVYKGKAFTAVGFLQYKFDEYFENWWLLQTQNKVITYLVEDAFDYNIYEEIVIENQNKFNPTFSNETVVKNYGTFYTQSKEKPNSIGVHGRLNLEKNHNAVEIYVLSNTEKIICIKDYFKENIQKLYSITPIKLNELNWKNNIKPFTCKKIEHLCQGCKNKIVVNHLPFTKNVVCENCGTKYIVQNSSFEKQGSYGFNLISDIKTGTVFNFNEVVYTVIGWQKKQDEYKYAWMEYYLLSTTHGQAFLSEYEGHWNFLTPQKVHPILPIEDSNTLLANDFEFQLFNDYRATIINAGGEFLSNTFNDKIINVKEFICPPYMWSREINTNDKQVTWFKGRYVSQIELQNATKSSITLSYPTGVGAIQPIKGYIRPNVLFQIALFCLALLVLTFLSTSYFKENKVMYEATHYKSDSSIYVEHVSPHFNLTKWRSNLEIDIYAPLDNNWLEVEIVLVNAKTGAKEVFEKGIEFYAGTEDGERWTEGKTKDEFYISSIPAGEYFIKYKASQPSTSNFDTLNYTITVINDVAVWRNFYITLFFIAILFLLYWLYMRHKDNQRWANSPFYHLNQNDE